MDKAWNDDGMRIGIRADASKSIGTGHVMRQIALAQYLLSQNHEVTLFASVTGPDWLRRYVESQSGLVWVEVEEGDFSEDPLLADGAVNALVIDSYTLNQKALQLLEKAIPKVAVIVDGPWQDVSGKLAITPTFDRNPPWASEYQKRFEEFHWGPEFFMLRREVVEARKMRAERTSNPEPRIVVALGGSDLGGRTAQIAEILAKAFPQAVVDAFVSRAVPPGKPGTKQSGIVRFNEAGPIFTQHLENADLAVVGAGTTVAEMSFLEVPAIFIVIADNQKGNGEMITKLMLGEVLYLDGFALKESLMAYVEEFFQRGPKMGFLGLGGKISIDGLGASRVASYIISN